MDVARRRLQDTQRDDSAKHYQRSSICAATRAAVARNIQARHMKYGALAYAASCMMTIAYASRERRFSESDYLLRMRARRFATAPYTDERFRCYAPPFCYLLRCLHSLFSHRLFSPRHDAFMLSSSYFLRLSCRRCRHYFLHASPPFPSSLPV